MVILKKLKNPEISGNFLIKLCGLVKMYYVLTTKGCSIAFGDKENVLFERK